MRQLLLVVIAQMALMANHPIVAKVEADNYSYLTGKTRKTGLVTDRLSVKEKVVWQRIERIVFAEDSAHQPLHPTLRNLWQWIETSGHTVYVEIVNLKITKACTAGEFIIERFDPLGEQHIAIIQLNLSSINQAHVGVLARRPDGFIPFLGLDRQERYAEVLGHELSHAVHILTNLNRTRLVEEKVQQTNRIFLSLPDRHKVKLAADLKLRLSQRDALLKELEDQAQAVEKKVWEEMTTRKMRQPGWLYLAGNKQ